jgi:hypothetical protein
MPLPAFLPFLGPFALGIVLSPFGFDGKTPPGHLLLHQLPRRHMQIARSAQ